MFKVGDKYKLVDPDGALMEDTPKGTILTVKQTSESGVFASVEGVIGEEDCQVIDEQDVLHGHLVKTTSVGGLHMDLTLDTTTTTDVREILCRAVEQIHDKTGIRIEELDFSWTDVGDGPYIHSIHIEGGVNGSD